MLLTPKVLFAGVIIIFGVLFLKNMIFGGNKESSLFCIVAMATSLICLLFMQNSILNTVLFKI